MSNTVVQTNILALNSHRNMKTVGTNQARASQKLSSGYKINSAADDAAGLAISEKMRAQIRGLDMASKNAQDASSLIQTAEGGMQEIDNMLQRIRELVDQAANDTNENSAGTGDREKMQDEINQLVTEIDAMSGRVEFNRKKIIDGSYADKETVIAAMEATSTAAASIISDLTLDVSTAHSAYETASDKYSDAVVAYGADETATNRGIMEDAKLAMEAASASHTTLTNMKSDYTLYVSNLSDGISDRNALETKSIYFQIGANAYQGMNVNINRIKSDVLGIGDGEGHSFINVFKDTGIDITGILNTMDKALSTVTAERSRLGALQNRVEYSMKSLDISSENLTDAESRVRDTDMAKEMMNYTKANVLQQAAVSMLTQANQQPQNVLQLLR